MKYTDDQLKAMAKEVLDAMKVGDMRATALIQILSFSFGISPVECEARIRRISEVGNDA